MPQRNFERNARIFKNDRIGREFPPLSIDSLGAQHRKWTKKFLKDSDRAHERDLIRRFLNVPRHMHPNEVKQQLHPFFDGFSKSAIVSEVKAKAHQAFIFDRVNRKPSVQVKHVDNWRDQRRVGGSFPVPLTRDEMITEHRTGQRKIEAARLHQRKLEDASIRQWRVMV